MSDRTEPYATSIRLAVILALLFAGSTAPGAPAKETADVIKLQPVTFNQWQQRLAAYRGEIIIVDFWATWCAPCIERFPRMVALHDKYGSAGKIRFVSMCLDEREDQKAIERAYDFLVKQRARFDNFRMDEIIPDAFDKLNLVGIPAVLIYDQTGRLRYRLTGDNPNKQFTDEDVEAAIKALLANSR